MDVESLVQEFKEICSCLDDSNDPDEVSLPNQKEHYNPGRNVWDTWHLLHENANTSCTGYGLQHCLGRGAEEKLVTSIFLA